MENVGNPSRSFKILLASVAALALVALGSTGFLWFKLQDTQTASAPDETASVVEAVSEHLILPPGETPSLVTVENLDQVRGQPFFANAQVGDKVLVYKQAAKAVLWRPSAGKIVEVYPINLSGQ